MKQFLKYVLATVTGIILVMVIMGVLGAISLVGMAAASAGNTQVEENSVFALSLSGQLNERASDNPLSELTGQVSKNLGLAAGGAPAPTGKGRGICSPCASDRRRQSPGTRSPTPCITSAPGPGTGTII